MPTGIVSAAVELLRLAATDLPPDIEEALGTARGRETEAAARSTLSVTLDNIRVARAESRPICQDTGVPIFFVRCARGQSQQAMAEALREAVRIATREVPLRPNAVDPVTGRNTGDGTGAGLPIIYMSESPHDYSLIDLLLKGGGSENISQSYKLPDGALGAERDLAGVRLAVLDAVHKAQGRGCPPYVIGVGIGGMKDDTAMLAKRQLLRPIPDTNENSALARFERTVLEEINSLGIGPSGLGGATTAIGLKVGAHARHPATFLVEVSFGCWAHRRRTLRLQEGEAAYE